MSAACPLAVLFAMFSACGPSQSADRAVALASVDALGAPGVPTPPPVAPPARPADQPPLPTTLPDAAAPADVAPLDVAPEKPDAAPVIAAPDAAPEVMAPPEVGEVAPPPVIARFVEVSFAAAPATIDLSAAGAIDWAHYGYQDSRAINRKKAVAPLIAMTPLAGASLDHYADRPVRFSWSDGTPTDRASNINDGVNVGETVKHGFQVRVEGTPARRRVLELYVGAWHARARLEVRLQREGTNTPPAPLYMDDSLTAAHPGKDRVYRIVFQPGGGEKLVVNWSLESMDDEFGNVTLQAAVLAE
jgi:hypothetical protein